MGTSKHKFLTILSVFTLSVFLVCPAGYGLSIVYPTSANYNHSSLCPAGDGSSHLTPDPVQNAGEFFSLSSISNEVKSELGSGDTSFSGWTFNYDTWLTASGTLYIDVYKSVFYSNHSSGAHFQARYVKGSGDPSTLRWVQYVDPDKPFDPDQLYNVNTGLPGSNGPIAPANGGFIDPYPNDGTDGGPFYWHGGEISSYTSGADSFGGYDLKFVDHPRVFHPPTSTNGMDFELYLVSWDGAKTVNFLGGIQWGFEGACAVPEPATLGLCLAGLGAVIPLKKRRNRYEQT